MVQVIQNPILQSLTKHYRNAAKYLLLARFNPETRAVTRFQNKSKTLSITHYLPSPVQIYLT